MKRRGFCYTN